MDHKDSVINGLPCIKRISETLMTSLTESTFNLY